MKGYGASLVVGASGAALLLFGILSSTDAGTVGGVAFGAMILGAGAMLGADTAKARRNVRANARLGLQLDDRTLRAIQARQDRSEQTGAARRVDE